MTTADENGTRPAGRARTDRMTSVGNNIPRGTALGIVIPEWVESAACASVDPELFFPDAGQWGQARAAKAICRQCPAIALCLEASLTRGDHYGIAGGMTERERRPLIHARKVAA